MRFRSVALVLVALALGLLAVPLAVEAQTAGKVYRIGLLESPSPPFPLRRMIGMLYSLGYIDGKNAAFERRAASADEKLVKLAEELVRSKVDVIVVTGLPAIRAAKNATKTTPIVIVVEGDPVETGLVRSLARPGGNVTGLTLRNPELAGKRLELLKETVPALVCVGVLWDPREPANVEHWKGAQRAARLMGLDLRSLEVGTKYEIESLFEVAAKEHCGVLVSDGYVTRAHGRRIVALAQANRIPAMYAQGTIWVSLYGGLMSYGANPYHLLQRAAVYVDKILKGTNPADLPVEQSSRFDLTINLKAAKALGLTIPPSVLIRAHKIVEVESYGR